MSLNTAYFQNTIYFPKTIDFFAVRTNFLFEIQTNIWRDTYVSRRKFSFCISELKLTNLIC